MNEYEKGQKLGVNYDLRKNVFKSVSDFTMQDLSNFHNTHINNDNYIYMILGDKDVLDMGVLRGYGEITSLTLKDIFGY